MWQQPPREEERREWKNGREKRGVIKVRRRWAAAPYLHTVVEDETVQRITENSKVESEPKEVGVATSSLPPPPRSSEMRVKNKWVSSSSFRGESESKNGQRERLI